MSGQRIDSTLSVVNVEFELGEDNCRNLKQCHKYVTRIRQNLIGRYIGEEKPFDGQVVAAWLDLRGLEFNDYLGKVKKRYKGNIIRDAQKSDRQAYICKPFVKELFIPDIVEINHSKEKRSGGVMKPAYLRSVEDMGGAPSKYIDMELPGCPVHYDYWWGVFLPRDGYTQGSVVTNEKLLAYINLRRIGNFALYNLIIGHGDYLQHGIMYRLHFAVIEWLCDRNNVYSKGLSHLIYAGFNQGGEGLQLWKKKTAFEPAYLILNDSGNIISKCLISVAKPIKNILRTIRSS